MNGRITAALAAAMLLGSVLGCGDVPTEYGPSTGRLGRRSLNGFAGLRTAFEQAGHETHDVRRLTPRVRRTDAIVWTPTALTSIQPDVGEWLDRWFREGGKTLVYVVPDSGSEADYWIQASRLAPPEQRLEYRRRAARSINRRMQWRLNRGQFPSNGWFQVEAIRTCQPLGRLSGPWAADLQSPGANPGAGSTDRAADGDGAAGGRDPTTGLTRCHEFRLQPYDDSNSSAAVQVGGPGGGGGPPGGGPTGPSAPWSFSQPTERSPIPTVFRTLLQSAAGDTVVAEVTSSRWSDSRILVVAGGSLLNNFGLTHDRYRRLAERVIEASTPAGASELHSGFLLSDWSGIPVSEPDPGVPKASGMELLTVWPLSLVTMHGVMLGIVACLMLLPIFGRPRRVRYRSPAHFGDHLDAVAALMSRTGGERFARERISEYMRRVRGENSGPWVLAESAREASPTAGSGSSPRGDDTAEDDTPPQDHRETETIR